jgi:Tfp pilus assembly protein PilF
MNFSREFLKMKWSAILVVILFLLLNGCDSAKQPAKESGQAAESSHGAIQQAVKLIETARSEGRSDGFLKAEALLRDALDADPRNDAVMVALAEVLLSGDIAGREARPREARELFVQALQINPRNAQAARGLANVTAYEARAVAGQGQKPDKN